MKAKWFLALALSVLLAAAPPYALGVKSGRIAWRASSEDWRLTDAPASSLPCAADREALSRGLVFGSRAGLTRALEDYCP